MRWVNVGGGIVSARAVLLRVRGLAPPRALRLRAPCSFVLLSQSLSVVGGNKRWVIVGGGIVSAPDIRSGVPGFSPVVVTHLWAPCVFEWI